MSNLAQIITRKVRQEYKGKRFTVLEFVEFVKSCLEIAAEIESSKEYYGHRELNIIRQEALPISLALQSELLGYEFIEPSFEDHAKYDALGFTSDGSQYFLEVTCDKDGKLDLVRGEHLEKFGFAGLIGNTIESLERAIHNNEPDIGLAISSDEIILHCINGIQKRILAKTQKNYPPNTVLIVAFEGDFRASTFEAILKGIVIPPDNSFSKILLVSYSSKQSARLL